MTNFNHTNSTSCTAEAYLGNMCRDELLFYQECVAHTDGSEVNILSNENQEETEEQVRQLLLGLELLGPSPECMQGAKSLLCLYLFGLCSSSGEIILPAHEQCETVRSDICVMEWQRATAFLGMNQLPQCESLSETSTDCSGKSFFQWISYGCRWGHIRKFRLAKQLAYNYDSSIYICVYYIF